MSDGISSIAGDEAARGGESAAFDNSHGESNALSSIKHGLRTPLNQIIGYTEMLQEEAGDQELEEYLADLQKIHTAGGQLLALINDGLAAWKFEAGQIDLNGMRFEMRTPLNLIIGYSEMCQDIAQDQGNRKLIADFRKITAAAKNLLTLFDSPTFPEQVEIGLKERQAVGASREMLARPAGVLLEGQTERPPQTGSILIIDDNEMNRDMLCRRLERQGYTVIEVENGRQAVKLLKNKKFDLILLDVLMPEINGFETLELIKNDPTLRHIPVIMLSAVDELDSTVKCIERGAEDYIQKPFNPVLLQARINASMDKKRMRDLELQTLAELRLEREKSERLLLNILPKAIAERMKNGETTIAEKFNDATVLYADLVNFTQQATKIAPPKIVHLLNDIFSGFDWLVDLKGLEKIKTFGDGYLVVSGAPTPRADHAEVMAEVVLEMQRVLTRFNLRNNVDFAVRFGLNSGPVMAGVVGRKNFFYNVWGESVSLCRELEEQCKPGFVQVSQSTYDLLKSKYQFQVSEGIDAKGKGHTPAYYLTGKIAGTAI